jgi:hypothetical protein
LNSYANYTFVASNSDYQFATDDNSDIPLFLNSFYFFGVGFDEEQDYPVTCPNTIVATTQECPAGTLAFQGDENGIFTPSTDCTAYENVTVTPNTWVTTRNVSIANGGTYVYRLPTIPAGASYINFTIISDSADLEGAVGSNYVPNGQSDGGDEHYLIYFDYEVNIVGTPYYAYQAFYYSPRWNTDAYISIDNYDSTPYTLYLTVDVVTCANAALTGPYCNQTLVNISALTGGAYSGSVGSATDYYVHFFLDVPAWTWFPNPVAFTASSTINYIYARDNTYSNDNDETDGSFEDSDYLVNNGFDNDYFYTDASTFSLTPYDLFAPWAIRWVFTVECINPGCSFTSSVTLPAPSPPSSGPAPTFVPSVPTAPVAPVPYVPYAPYAPVPHAPVAPSQAPSGSASAVSFSLALVVLALIAAVF